MPALSSPCLNRSLHTVLDVLPPTLRCAVLLHLIQPSSSPSQGSSDHPVSPEVAALLLQRLRKDVAATQTTVLSTAHNQPDLLTSPWPLQLACQIMQQTLQSSTRHIHNQPAASSSPTEQHIMHLCICAPVQAHADLCAAGLSIVRLIGLRMVRVNTASQYSTAQQTADAPSSCVHESISTPEQAHQQCLQCLRLLQQEVLLPLAEWLDTRLEALHTDVVAASAESNQPDPAALGDMPPGAAPLLPEAVAEFTALSRLAAAVEAVQELCDE